MRKDDDVLLYLPSFKKKMIRISVSPRYQTLPASRYAFYRKRIELSRWNDIKYLIRKRWKLEIFALQIETRKLKPKCTDLMSN